VSRDLTISAFSCHGNPLTPDKAFAEESDSVLRKTIKLASLLGVPVVNVFSGTAGDSDEAKQPNWPVVPWLLEYGDILIWQCENKLIPYWKEIGELAEQHNAKIGLELHAGFQVHRPYTLLKLREATSKYDRCKLRPKSYGVALITATSLAAEIGSFRRFPTPKQFMAYVGLIPGEFSSGEKRRQGEITKAGHRHVRRLLIESAWSYRYQPAVKGDLKRRLDRLSPAIQGILWKAQNRLHKRYFQLLSRGKEGGKAITAVARELACFIWAITQELEDTSRS
jgi:hypothetical protein